MQGKMPDFQGPRAAQVLASQIGAGFRSSQPQAGGLRRGNDNTRNDTPLNAYTAAKQENTASNPFGINFKTLG